MSDKRPSRSRIPVQIPVNVEIGVPGLPALAKIADLWLECQVDLLTGAEATMIQWLERQREAADTLGQAIHRMSECRRPEDFMAVQQQFWSDCAQRTASETTAFGSACYELSRKAAADIGDAGRAVMDNVRDAGTTMLTAAGSKPAPKVSEETA
jgi:hypothetical protein